LALNDRSVAGSSQGRNEGEQLGTNKVAVWNARLPEEEFVIAWAWLSREQPVAGRMLTLV
jgi:hypothetical protein